MKEYGDTFLLAPFREFYREVIRLRRMVVTGAWAAAPNAVPATADSAEGEASDLKTPAGTWVYFPDVIPEHEPETSTARGAAWVSPPAGTAAPWEGTPAHDANAPTPPASNGNGNNGNTQLAPTDDMRASTFVWQRLVSLFERHEAQAWRYGGT